MPCIAHAQKLSGALSAACDPDFDAAFYRPYAAAAHTALLALCSARDELHARTGKDPVHALVFRLKTPASIRGKLLKKGLPSTADAASAALSDIAGLRAVLSDVQSIYEFARLVQRSSAVFCFAQHDYIAVPKPSGYQSLHLLMHVPVSLGQGTLMVPAELQLRTQAMDVWACAEHAIVYKPIR